MKPSSACIARLMGVCFTRLTTLSLLALAVPANADVAISLRYFKVSGTSHYHLYLYSDDGKVIRQLTKPEQAHDRAPVFAPSGDEIVFEREEGKVKTVCSIKPNGSGLRQLKAAPEWYQPDAAPEYFGFRATAEAMEPLWVRNESERVCKVPGGKEELVVPKAHEPDWDDKKATAFFGLVLRRPGAKDKLVFTNESQESNFGQFATNAQGPFMQRPLRLAFLWWHMGSSDGYQLAALDLDGSRLVALSKNPAVAIPHGNRAGFYVVAQERYQPLGDGKKTVNCLYLDWWNEKLERTRFARAISLFGGACVHAKDQPALVIPATFGG